MKHQTRSDQEHLRNILKNQPTSDQEYIKESLEESAQERPRISREERLEESASDQEYLQKGHCGLLQEKKSQV